MKKSFSMVELLFAIIIIALAIGALPSVVNQVKESTDVSINQEAIWMASSVMYNILDHRWDENSSQANVPTVKALDVSNQGDTDFNRTAGTRFRIGHIKADGRRSLFTNTTPPSYPTATLGFDDNDPTIAGEKVEDDIDDFNEINNKDLSEDNYVSRLQYKKNYKIDVNVFYIDDGKTSAPDGSNINYKDLQIVTFKLNPADITTSGSTNIKFIEINVKYCEDEYENTIFKLKAFSSNIGEYSDLTNRVF